MVDLVSPSSATVQVNRAVVDSDLTILIGHTAGNPYGGFAAATRCPPPA